jgi:hypothetical protein
MGLLDDAIRDHLDLKRRRGGDPTEIERAEREALGPVRRAPEPLVDDLPAIGDEEVLYDDAAPVGGPAPAAEAPGAPLFDEPFTDEDLLAEDDDEWLEEDEHPPLTFEAPPEAPAAAAPAPPAPVFDDPEPAAATPPSAPPPVAAPQPGPAAPPAPDEDPGLSDETVEYRVEDALAAEERPTGEEDVLEETPEFLQDTPDHDRLWFEQRPPRDFDFDG